MRRIGPAVFLLSVLALSACTSSSAPSNPTATAPPPTIAAAAETVGLVTDIGRLHDRSYNDLSFRGIQDAHAAEGVKYHVLESRSEKDYVPYLTQFAKQGTTLVVAVGYTMRTAVYQVASTYPSVHFALIDASPVDDSGLVHNLPNVADVFFQEQESGYLAGVIAGLMEKERVGAATHGVIGYMGAQSMPPVDRYLAGYVAGALKVDPHIKVVGDYAGSFTDYKAGHTIGMKQIAGGADILFQVAATSGVGYLSAAQEAGRYGIGADVDQSYLGPFVITSALKRVDIVVRELIDDVRTGTFHSGLHRYGLRDGATGIAPPSKIVPGSIAKASKVYAIKIINGQIVPPTSIPQH